MHPRALTRPARAVATGAALLGLALATTSCDVGRPPAVSVEGRDISAEHVDDLLAAFVASDPEANGELLDGEGEDTFQMERVADILTTLTIQTIQAELAEREGAEPSAEERSEAERLVRNSFAAGAEAEADPTTGEVSEETAQAQETSQAVFDDLEADTQEWLIDLRAATLALARVAGEGADVSEQAREIYAADPSAFEALCLRAIVVLPEDLPAVQDRLAAGEDFGQVSSEVSVDQQLAAQGGSLGDCLRISDLEGRLPPDLVQQLGELEEGGVSDEFPIPADPTTGTPAQSALFEVQERQEPAFEDVQAEIEATLPPPGEAALGELVEAAIADVEVDVDPRFGTWVPDRQRCLELQPDRPERAGCIVPPAGARDAGASDDADG